MRIFLDANVVFSASKSDGAVRLLVRRLLDAGHECLADEYVVIEARRNLEAKGPEAMLERLESIKYHHDRVNKTYYGGDLRSWQRYIKHLPLSIDIIPEPFSVRLQGFTGVCSMRSLNATTTSWRGV